MSISSDELEEYYFALSEARERVEALESDLELAQLFLEWSESEYEDALQEYQENESES